MQTQNQFLRNNNYWIPEQRRVLTEEEREQEEQIKFEEEVKEEESKLEHKFMVALEYCNWLPEGRIKKEVKKCYPHCCFNHQVGLPKRKYRDQETNEEFEGEECELYDYEKRMIMLYEHYRYYAQNKVRGAGATEVLAVRHMAFKYAVANRIQGRKYLLAAGINQIVAARIFERIVLLLKPYAALVFSEIPKISKPTELKFMGGGVALALSSDPNAPRSLENIGDVLLDEAAFWDLADDSPVPRAYEPFVVKSGAHIGVFSTPNGQRGFYWSKIFNPDVRTKYYRHVVTLEEVKNVPVPIIDVAEAKRMEIEDPDLFAQEYGNKFILPSSSVFGDVFIKGSHQAWF